MLSLAIIAALNQKVVNLGFPKLGCIRDSFGSAGSQILISLAVS